MPPLAGLDDQGRACERRQGEEHSKGLSLEDVLHGQTPNQVGNPHRIPAPTVRAIAASSIKAQVKRARFAFTVFLPSDEG